MLALREKKIKPLPPLFLVQLDPQKVAAAKHGSERMTTDLSRRMRYSRLRGGSAALGRVGLGEVLMVLLLWTMDRLLKDGLGLVDLELGLEVWGVV